MVGSDGAGLDRLKAAMVARSMMRDWAGGAELVELVRAAHDAGWLDRLRGAITAGKLAADAGVPVEHATDMLAVLVSAGVVEVSDGTYRLSPAFDALVEGVAGVGMPAVLDAVDLARARTATGPTVHKGLNGMQSLVLARDWGVRPGPAARELFGLLYDALPEYRERLEQGGPLLDVGSGVGGALLTTLTLFEKLHAVGIENVPEVAKEVQRRAQQANVTTRVRIRATDASTMDDENVFAVSFWAQAFFPAGTRADVLAAIFRALKPGGLLLMQELPPSATTTARAHLDRLFFRQLGIPYGITADELAAEAATAGFRRSAIVESPAGRLVLVRKPGE